MKDYNSYNHGMNRIDKIRCLPPGHARCHASQDGLTHVYDEYILFYHVL